MEAFFVVFLLTFSTLSFSYASTPDFFYLVLQWPGSQCITKEGCCFPKSVKPTKDFIVSGFQPFYFNGTRPTHCNSHKLNFSMIADMTKILEKRWPSITCPGRDSKNLWSNEWSTFGTCSESTFNEHQYFDGAVRLMRRINLLTVLNNAGIQANGSSYSLNAIQDAIISASLHPPGFDCNKDKYENLQLHKITLCSDFNGKHIVECPGLPMGSCSSHFNFPRI